MRLTVIGSSGSFPSVDSPASCYLVQAPDGDRTASVVLDLGSGALGGLQRHLDLTELDAVLLSHLHPDHFLDLCGLYVARRYHPASPVAHRLPVHGPAGTLARLSQAYGDDGDGRMEHVYDVRGWSPGQRQAIGPLTVTARRVEHPVDAYGLRVEHGGRVLSYSGDTDECDALVELARDADVLLAEASFQEGRDTVRGVHLTGRRAGRVAAAAGARMLLLTHLPPWTDPDVVRAEAEQVYPGPVRVARPGLTLEL